MKNKGRVLFFMGIFGVVFICSFDTIVGKPVNDITGPKSISALIVFGLFIVTGIYYMLRTSK